MAQQAKVYISMPRPFLEELDRTAREEHLSRSALIREAVKLYMTLRGEAPQPRFFALSAALRRSFTGLDEAELEERIDRAVKRARGRAGA